MGNFGMRLASCGVALVMLSASESNSGAQNASDLRCLTVASVNANSQDPKMQIGATIAAMYWIGRLQGRDPAFDIETGLVRTANAMTPDQLQSENIRCALAIKAQGRALVEMGKRISARAGGQSL